MNKFFPFLTLVGIALSGCTLAPKYERPAAPVSTNWPDGSTYNNSATNAVADIGWREFFHDPRLQELIELSLTNNRDLRVAVLNVEQSRAQYRIERAALFPNIDASGNYIRQRTSKDFLLPGEPVLSSQYSVSLGTTAYEVDLFGRIRSLKTAALENYFATEEARKSAQIALVAEVANQYLAERAFEEELQMTRQTLDAVQNSYNLIKQSYDVGVSSELDLRSAEAQVESAKANAAAFEQQRDQAQHALTLLVGEPLPADLPPPQSLNEQRLLTDLPPGLPSDLLQRRPDILAAEHELKSANANIGAARAAFFPAIKITADAGFSSAQLSSLFDAGSGMWLFNPQITLPIFEGGRNKANLDVAKISKLIEVANYEKAIQTAFREVADALTAKKFLDEQLADQTALVKAEQRRYDLADVRYRNGVDDYLVVLTAQQDLFTAQRNQIVTQYARFSNLIGLYQALGGGWRENSPQP
ncbi:MAG TPA: AdeC/AdeK/OprM family multidrug efflux complex outer membrane factor [Verrucomicrobiae bacterium]|nr:AdeC/AdeK/OprM family multidrug efflux complex outer membrane factor [Verrucomicrobiae bacterium]